GDGAGPVRGPGDLHARGIRCRVVTHRDLRASERASEEIRAGRRLDAVGRPARVVQPDSRLQSDHFVSYPVRGAGQLETFEVASHQIEDGADGDAPLRPLGVVSAQRKLDSSRVTAAHGAQDAQLEAVQSATPANGEI